MLVTLYVVSLLNLFCQNKQKNRENRTYLQIFLKFDCLLFLLYTLSLFRIMRAGSHYDLTVTSQNLPLPLFLQFWRIIRHSDVKSDFFEWLSLNLGRRYHHKTLIIANLLRVGQVCYQLSHLRNMKLFSIRVKAIFEPLVLRRKGNVCLLLKKMLRNWSLSSVKWFCAGGRNEICCADDKHNCLSTMGAKELSDSNFN